MASAWGNSWGTSWANSWKARAPTPVPVYPAEADVRSGVTYGPTGTDYTGTMTGGGSGTVYLRRGR